MATRTSSRLCARRARAAAAAAAAAATVAALPLLEQSPAVATVPSKNKPKRTAQEIAVQKRLVHDATDVYEKELERVFPNKVSRKFNQTLLQAYAGVTIDSVTSMHRRRVKKRQKEANNARARSIYSSGEDATATAAAMPGSVKRSHSTSVGCDDLWKDDLTDDAKASETSALPTSQS
jgi:hypothetical protein